MFKIDYKFFASLSQMAVTFREAVLYFRSPIIWLNYKKDFERLNCKNPLWHLNIISHVLWRRIFMTFFLLTILFFLETKQ